MTAEERRLRRLAAWAKYNRSTKGKARYERYEAKHPGRSAWSPLMLNKRSAGPEGGTQ